MPELQLAILEDDTGSGVIDPDGDPLVDAEAGAWGAVVSTDMHMVEDLQARIDAFIGATEDAPTTLVTADDFFAAVVNNAAGLAPVPAPVATSRRAGTNPAPVVSAPRLEFAVYGDEPVSCLLRIDQKRIIDQQARAVGSTLAGLSTPLGVVIDAVAETTTPSSGRSKVFDGYAVKVAALSAEIRKANASISRLSAAAWQADQDFATLAPEAGGFGDQLVAMLKSLDAALTNAAAALALPLTYAPKQAELLKVLADVGVPANLRALLAKAIVLTRRAGTTLTAARTQLAAASTDATALAARHKQLYAAAAGLWAPARFPRALGAGTLSGLVGGVQAALSAAEQRFATVVTVGEALHRNAAQLTTDATKGALARLDAACTQLTLVVDAAAAEARAVGPRVDALHAALTRTRADLQRVLGATRGVAAACRAVETQLLAADMLRGLGERLGRDIAPFAGLLDALPPAAAAAGAAPSAARQTGQKVQPKPPAGAPPPAQAAVRMAIAAAGKGLDPLWKRAEAFVGAYLSRASRTCWGSTSTSLMCRSSWPRWPPR